MYNWSGAADLSKLNLYYCGENFEYFKKKKNTTRLTALTFGNTSRMLTISRKEYLRNGNTVKTMYK